LGRVAAGFDAGLLFAGILAWAILVLQTVEKNAGGYCEDYAACYEARPLELVIQGSFALAGAAAATWLTARCIRYARGRGSLDARMVAMVIVLFACAAAWILYTDAQGLYDLTPAS
jgi:hypothetical protein